MAHGFDLPYEPIPQKLYENPELFRGYIPGKSASWVETTDFKIYQHFVMEGRTKPANPYMGMMQALHDNAISQATDEFIVGKKVVAIIGDHKLSRGSDTYRSAAMIARDLTRKNFLICTGGGPGAMEAGHLGAAMANSPDTDMDAAIAKLKKKPVVPDLGKIVNFKGEVDEKLAHQAEEWFRPSFEIAQSIPAAGKSLAIPTWHYGHEPSTPFATHIAKYFQNSVREDGLVAIAQQGIICMEGKVGTIQEVFQDSTQNYYLTYEQFSPMVIFGEEYWTKTYPVVAVLQALFQDRFSKYVLVTDKPIAAINFVEQLSSGAG